MNKYRPQTISRLLGKKFERSTWHKTRIKGCNMCTSGFTVGANYDGTVIIEINRRPNFTLKDISDYLTANGIKHTVNEFSIWI